MLLEHPTGKTCLAFQLASGMARFTPIPVNYFISSCLQHLVSNVCHKRGNSRTLESSLNLQMLVDWERGEYTFQERFGLAKYKIQYRKSALSSLLQIQRTNMVLHMEVLVLLNRCQ